MHTPPTIKPDELAQWLGYKSGSTFQNAASRLNKHHGFPPKLPGKPLWSRSAVLAWINSAGGLDNTRTGAPLLDPDYDELGNNGHRSLESLYGAAQ